MCLVVKDIELVRRGGVDVVIEVNSSLRSELEMR